MEYLADTHMHSIFSYDGQMCFEEMIQQGRELGLKYMAFTEHLELGQIAIKQFLNRYKVYRRKLDQLQEQNPDITLIKGLEFTNPEKYPKELEIVNSLDIDYIIGSNHELPSTQTEKEILLYYKKILTIVRNGGIDTLAHMDYLRRKYDDSAVNDDVIKEIYSTMQKNNIALEINTSAVRRKGLDSFPSNKKLKLYRDTNGSMITIGSDAHRLNEIYDHIPELSKTADELGFTKGLYLKRKFTPLASNAHSSSF